MGGSNTNVKHVISPLQTPPLALALAPPPARLPIALFPRLLRLRIRFLRHWLWYLLPIAPAPKPVVQLLLRKPPRPAPSHTTSPPPLSSETALPIPPPPPSALAPASILLAPLPKLCLPTSSIPPASYHFTHRYAHALRLPPFSPASIALLVSISTAPAISWLFEHLPLACGAGKNTSAGCFQALFNGRAILT